MLIFSVFVSGLVIGQTNPYIQAQILFDKKQYKQAVELLNLHIATYPKHGKSIKLRAESNIELRNYQLAIDDISKLKYTEFDDTYLLLARAYAGIQKNDLAFENLNKYLSTNTKIPEPDIKSYPEFQLLKSNNTWVNLWKTDRYTSKEIILNNAKYAIKSDNLAEAADRLDEYLIKYTRSAEAYLLRGNIYYENNEFKLASDCYEKALKIEPKDEACLLAQAQCNNKLHKYKSANELFNSIIQSDSLVIAAFYGRAKSLVELGETELAKGDIVKYRTYYPDNADAQYLEAYIDTKNGDFLNAIANYGKLIKANPARPDYFIARANAYMVTKTYKYAIKDYSMALDLNPRNVEVFKLKAKAHELAGEINQACNEWHHAANLGDVESMDNLHKYCK